MREQLKGEAMMKTYEIDGKSITASEAWGTYVGDQTPCEFMENSWTRGADMAVSAHIHDHKFFCEMDKESRVQAHWALVAYIVAETGE